MIEMDYLFSRFLHPMTAGKYTDRYLIRDYGYKIFISLSRLLW
jgi:hypothetical protein